MDLLECLALSSHFKQVFPVNKEIAIFGNADIVVDRELVEEESFSFTPLVYGRSYGMHQIGVAEENFFGF